MNAFAIAILALLPFSPAALSQTVPDAPAHAPDPAWSQLESLSIGSPVVVSTEDGRTVHCLFAGVSDAYLFCNPAGNPAGVGYRFNHADVIGVDLDLSARQFGLARPPERNYHPAWISSMIAGGLIVGLAATRSTDAGSAAKAGLLGAVVVGAIGAPLAFLPHPEMAPSAPQPYIFSTHLRFPVRSFSHKRPR